MIIKVFGQLRDVVKEENISINDVKNMNDLKGYLYFVYPALKEKEFTIAVNKQIVHGDVLLQQNAEIALLPPFSGG